MNEAQTVSDREMGVISEKVENTEMLVEKIFNLLNGRDGLVTETELNKKGIDENKKEIAWIKKTFITTMFVALIVLCVRGMWSYAFTESEVKNKTVYTIP